MAFTGFYYLSCFDDVDLLHSNSNVKKSWGEGIFYLPYLGGGGSMVRRCLELGQGKLIAIMTTTNSWFTREKENKTKEAKYRKERAPIQGWIIS